MLDPVLAGVDIGSVSIAIALLNSAREVLRFEYRPHGGRVRETLEGILDAIKPGPVAGVALTSGSPRVLQSAEPCDSQISLISGCRHFFPDVRSIIFVGGEKFGLIQFNSQGSYRGARSNSSCAAGTGSFLDQQARRLGFAGVDELVRRACASTTPPAKISTRCAVFARTDLVHAQQAGYSLEEICDGICRGLAQNIADTLLGGQPPEQPVVFAGGVSQNAAVRTHLERALKVPLLTHPLAPVFGAVGAALSLQQRGLPSSPMTISSDAARAKEYFFAPLDLRDAVTESADGAEKSVFNEGRFSAAHPVEVEEYAREPSGDVPVFMGVDIGSTSTKAILIDTGREPIAGFYTRTLGSPLTAVQALGEAIEDWQARTGAALRFLGVGTTGAGRKFIGSIVKADLVVDEITAHARAAFALDPGIDTIIEIGGQDAKFTTMRDGMVTFSHMNTVCAAGTGSFLEEQAHRLGCSLADYTRRVKGVSAPLSSDRCAVFMERDINNFLARGFSTDEILAAALYSVRENYLTKVARGAAIGERIAFQGATARNAALVAAFREGLGKPVLVSKYCHLTGALGVALLLAENKELAHQPSSFLGLAALREEIPVRAETCGLCANHCRLRIATVAGETVAYGFLCGRDYDAARYVDKNRSGFNLVKERRAAFAAAMPAAQPRKAEQAGQPPTEPPAEQAGQPPVEQPRLTGRPLIGIPAALGIYGQLPLWKSFFTELGVSFVTSEKFDAGITVGREVQGAEFCAPLASLHGHVKYLADKADWIFLPVLLEESRPGSSEPRVYCYYTQFSSALASGAADAALRERCLMPQASWTKWRDRTKRELHRALVKAGMTRLGETQVALAFENATAAYDRGVRLLQERFVAETALGGEPSVVLLGRPYNVLSPEMNKGINDIFGSLGVKTFFQDMVPYGAEDVRKIAPLLEMVHWLYAARILEVASVVADSPNLYPVFITSFKCTPDSFAIEYFKRILDAKAKPYLILQLDDHDSTLGYETRIEAGVASFRNHMRRLSGRRDAAHPARHPARQLPIVPHALSHLDGRTLLYPTWDPLVNPLLAANLRREGVDARELAEDSVVIRKAMRTNTGQCLPLNIIAQEAIDHVRRHGLDPARTAIWLPRSTLSCNFGMFTPFMKSLMEAEGGGMEQVEIYAGDVFYLDISRRAAVNCYKAYLVGGLLRRVGCRLRPYEIVPGSTDAAITLAMAILVPAFEGKTPKHEAMREAAALFDSLALADAPAAALERRPLERRPKVAVFGDLYVRDNDVMNQGLVRAIEEAGGEAVTTPYTEYIRIIAEAYFRKWALNGEHLKSLGFRALWVLADTLGRSCRDYFARFLDAEPAVSGEGTEEFLRAFGIRTEHTGESFENLLKIHHLVQAHPDLALFVQASPAFCCPSMVTEAMTRDIERLTGVPVVSITYDGTGQYQNEVIVPYVKYAAARPRAAAAPAGAASAAGRAAGPTRPGAPVSAR